MEIYHYSYTICMRVKRLLIIISTIIISLFVIAGTTFLILTNPNVKIAGWQELDTQKLERIHQTATITDKNGNIIADGIYSKNRIYTPIETIPEWTTDAFISIEDKRFYSHKGIDYIRMLGAAKNNILSASLREGASTITQQLIKNTHLSNEKTFGRKFREIRIAKQLEKEYDKKQILEAYLNIVYFGNNVYGIGQAAHTYFNKDVSQLDIAESALLAGIINNPSRFNPLAHPEQAIKRRNTVLDSMLKNNKLTSDTTKLEKEKPLQLKQGYKDIAACYIENAINEAGELLDCLQDELFEQKPTITVNANFALIKQISNSLSDILQDNRYKIRVLVIENNTSSVICDVSNTNNNTDILRQPGSAIKPFVSYAPAIEKKLIFPMSVILDEKTDFGGYSPKNFNNKYYGNVTVSDSLKNSLNVPAVKLTDMCGIPYSKSVATRFGLKFSDKDNGLAIALGGLSDGVTLNNLADAYSTLANGGKYKKSSYIKSISTNGKTAYVNKTAETKAVGDDTAYLITRMLLDCAQTGTAKKLSQFGNVAAKTGTVEHGDKNSDAYCVAYTSRYTVAVWYGNDENEANIYGGKEPTIAAKRVLEILADKSQFEIPDSVAKLDIDARKLQDEGAVYLAAPDLPKRYRISSYFSKNNLPKEYSYYELPEIFDLLDLPELEHFEIIDGFSE